MQTFGFVLTFIFLLSSLSSSQPVRVAAAASLQTVMDSLSTTFTRTMGIKLDIITGSSGQLTAQVRNGAPFDIFLSADNDYPLQLYKDGFSIDSPQVYAVGTLVLWTTRKVDLSVGMDVLKNPSVKNIAVANPKSAPYGRAAIEAITTFGSMKELESKLVYGESIAQTNHFINSGAADVGFTAKSVVAMQKANGTWVDVPRNLYTPIHQSAILLKHAAQNERAEKFFQFLFTQQARSIFRQFGYTVQ